MSDRLADNSSPLSLLTVLKPGGSSCFSADSKPPKSVDDMIQLMKTRELVVTDENNLNLQNMQSVKIAKEIFTICIYFDT